MSKKNVRRFPYMENRGNGTIAGIGKHCGVMDAVQFVCPNAIYPPRKV